MAPGNRSTSDLTTDTIYQGALTVNQPKTGYRFAIDALLLADFARVSPGQVVIDLGTGSGIVALSLALRMGSGRIIAVEIARNDGGAVRVSPGFVHCRAVNASRYPRYPLCVPAVIMRV